MTEYKKVEIKMICLHLFAVLIMGAVLNIIFLLCCPKDASWMLFLFSTGCTMLVVLLCYPFAILMGKVEDKIMKRSK